MKDFQQYLKLVFEADEIAAAPTANLEQASTPIQAYIAYRRELNGLMSKVQDTLGKVEMQIDAISGKVGGYLDTAKTQKEIEAQTASLKPTRVRPTIDRNRIDAMVAKYAPQQGEQQ